MTAVASPPADWATNKKMGTKVALMQISLELFHDANNPHSGICAMWLLQFGALIYNNI